MVKHVQAGISAAAFRMELEAQAFTLVDFFATWCGPCMAISPHIDNLAGQYPHVSFLKLDVDQCPEISQSSSINCMPTFILFARGREVARTSGADLEKIKGMLAKATSGAGAAAPLMNAAPQQWMGNNAGFAGYGAVKPSYGGNMWQNVPYGMAQPRFA